MIDENLTIALVARVSCGIYAGPHRHRAIAEFLVIVNELLCKPLRSPSGATSPRGGHFRLVIVQGCCRFHVHCGGCHYGPRRIVCPSQSDSWA